jgi:hypothetical protein
MKHSWIKTVSYRTSTSAHFLGALLLFSLSEAHAYSHWKDARPLEDSVEIKDMMKPQEENTNAKQQEGLSEPWSFRMWRDVIDRE